MPPLYRWIVGLASFIVPKRARGFWRQEWEAELRNRWRAAGQPAGLSLEVLGRSLGAVRDAWWFRRKYVPETTRGWRPASIPAWFLHRPLLAAALLVLAALAPYSLPRIWGSIDHLLLRPLPFRDPARVMMVYPVSPFVSEGAGVLPIKYLAWREKSQRFEALAAFRLLSFDFPDDRGRTRQVQVLNVSAPLLPVLGVGAALGRTISESDDREGAAPVAMLTWDLWQERFRGDPSVIGQSLYLGGKAHEVIGVLPRGFWFISRGARIWTPMAMELDPARHLPPLLTIIGKPAPQRIIPLSLLNQNLVQVVGRLKPDATPWQARLELRTIARKTYPTEGRDYVAVTPILEVHHRAIKPALYVGSAAAFLFLLVFGAGAGRPLLKRRPGERLRSEFAYWLFFLGKSFAGLAVLLGFWILVADPSNGFANEMGREVWLSWATTWLMALVVCAFALWSWKDQRSRCRVCLRRMRVPVTRGSSGSFLFDRPGVEYLCPAGHGTLYVSTAEPSQDSQEWSDVDDEYRNLFRGRP